MEKKDRPLRNGPFLRVVEKRRRVRHFESKNIMYPELFCAKKLKLLLTKKRSMV